MSNIAKFKKHHYTYKVINNLTNRYYLGMHSTNNLNDGYLGSGKRLWYELKKYGKENFTIVILNYFDSRESLIEAEKKLITKEDLENKNCLNLKLGGDGGFIDEEHERKFRIAALKFLKESWKDEKYREKMRIISSNNLKKQHKLGKMRYDTFKNKCHSEETKEKMRQHKGKQKKERNSQFGTCWIYNEELKINKKIKKEEVIPEGYKLGRKYF